MLVIDRHEVILDVFATRAKRRKPAQVRLARLEYSLPRLRRAWTPGRRVAAGLQRGEGEAQIELINGSGTKLLQPSGDRSGFGPSLDGSKKDRGSLRTLAIVGYTNGQINLLIA